MAPFALVANLATRWRHLHKLQICPPDGATCISCKFGHQVAQLALVQHLVIRFPEPSKFSCAIFALCLTQFVIIHTVCVLYPSSHDAIIDGDLFWSFNNSTKIWLYFNFWILGKHIQRIHIGVRPYPLLYPLSSSCLLTTIWWIVIDILIQQSVSQWYNIILLRTIGVLHLHYLRQISFKSDCNWCKIVHVHAAGGKPMAFKDLSTLEWHFLSNF